MKEIDLVKEILARNTDHDSPHELNHSIELKAIGIDSLKFMLIALELEQALGRPLFEVDKVPQINTVQDILDLV